MGWAHEGCRDPYALSSLTYLPPGNRSGPGDIGRKRGIRPGSNTACAPFFQSRLREDACLPHFPDAVLLALAEIARKNGVVTVAMGRTRVGLGKR